MVGRNAGHTRRVAAGPTNPETVWTSELDQVRGAGTPAVSNGQLYVPVDAISDTARHRYRIHALSAATGDERWQVPLRSEPNAPPAVSGDHIVVTAQRALEQGRIVCFQTRYGNEDWLVDIDAKLTAAPTIASGIVYVPDWRGRVHALSISDGSVRWSQHVDADSGGRTFTEPAAVLDETLYLGAQSGKTGVVALDATTGDTVEKKSTQAVTGGPVVHQRALSYRVINSLLPSTLMGRVSGHSTSLMDGYDRSQSMTGTCTYLPGTHSMRLAGAERIRKFKPAKSRLEHRL